MAIFANGSEPAWRQYQQQLEAFLGGDQDQIVIQPLAVAARVEWDTEMPAYNLYLKQRLGDQMPEWGPLYFPSPGRRVSDEYQVLLDRLSSSFIASSDLDKKKITQLDQDRRDARDKLQKLMAEVAAAWEVYIKLTPAELRTSRAQWEVDMGFSADRLLLRKQIDIAEGAYLLEINAAGGELAEVGRAISALSDPKAKILVPSTPEMAAMDSEAWDAAYKSFIEGDLQKFLAETRSVTFRFSENREESSTFQSRWGASAGVSWCVFFRAEGGTEHEEISRRWENETTSVEVSFRNINAFAIVRGQWFNGGLVRLALPHLDKKFWGPAGRLNVIPTQVLIATGLKVTVTTTEEVGRFFFERHQSGGGGGFRIGPFSFGARGSTTTERTETTVTQNGTTLTIEDTSGRAVLLAVASLQPANLLDNLEDAMPLNDPDMVQQALTVLKETRDSIQPVPMDKISLERIFVPREVEILQLSPRSL